MYVFILYHTTALVHKSSGRRSSSLKVFYTIGALKNFATFTEKKLCRSLFLGKVSLKRDSSTGVLLEMLRTYNFLRNLYLQQHFILGISNSSTLSLHSYGQSSLMFCGTRAKKL